MSDAHADRVAAGRDALRRHAWHEAFEHLSAADQQAALGPEALEDLAQAAQWVGRLEDCIAIRERAHARYLESGNPRRSGFVALLLAHDHFSRNRGALATGWLRRAERLLEPESDSLEYGYLLRTRGLLAKDVDDALGLARAAHEVATRFNDADLAALEIHEQGRLLVAKGEVADGLALLEEATVTAVSGTLTPFTTGIIYCNAIDTCRRLADYGRASEWTDAARQWCDRQGILAFPGVCRLHRASILRLRGAWADAAREATRASVELRPYNLGVTAEALYELGEIRFRLGDFAAAEDTFRQAHELGRDPQPGLALLRLAQGNVDAARTALRSALADHTRDALDRARLLPAQVEIGLAAGDLDAARAAAEELTGIATIYRTTALEAAAQCARGRVELAAEDDAGARRSLRAGCRLWQELDAPYETAQARTWLAEAFRMAGDLETATLELQAAHAGFERLGAAPDAARIALGMPAIPQAAHKVRQADTRTFMFTDIVGSTQLIEAIGDEAWADLLKWHDETLRRLFVTHGGEEIDHAGDGFFVAFEASAAALQCGVAIQRTLLEHRRTHGFAPQLRVGLHTATAERSGNAYRGHGVHVAARIAAVAEAGEILASESVEAEKGGITVSAPRVVHLKGVAEPVQLVTVAWR